MKTRQSLLTLGLISAAVAAITACGGGSSPGATASLSTIVMDGLIQNALVCVDTNGNGLCDTGEVQGRTDANGQVTLTVPAADVATAKLVAMIGTDAIDADTGKVATAYTLTAPVGRHGVISPLTTMVQAKIDADKAAGKTTSADDAANFVQTALTLKVSVFDNFIAKRSDSADYQRAGELAHGLAVTAQSSNCGWTAKVEDDKSAAQSNESRIQRGLLDKLKDLKSVDFSHASCSAGLSTSCDDFIKSQVAPVPLTSCVAPTSTTATTTTTTTTTPSASALAGKVLYAANCAVCHGMNPAMGGNKILTGANAPDEILKAIANNRGGMKALSTLIGTPQATDIAAYLATPGI